MRCTSLTPPASRCCQAPIAYQHPTADDQRGRQPPRGGHDGQRGGAGSGEADPPARTRGTGVVRGQLFVARRHDDHCEHAGDRGRHEQRDVEAHRALPSVANRSAG